MILNFVFFEITLRGPHARSSIRFVAKLSFKLTSLLKSDTLLGACFALPNMPNFAFSFRRVLKKVLKIVRLPYEIIVQNEGLTVEMCSAILSLRK